MSSTTFNVSFSFPLDSQCAQRLVENSLELVWQGSSEIPYRFPLLYGKWVQETMWAHLVGLTEIFALRGGGDEDWVIWKRVIVVVGRTVD